MNRASMRGGNGRSGAADFAAVTLLALGVRLVHLVQAQRVVFFHQPVSDGRAYWEWSGRIAAGDWLGEGVFFQAPLYPYFLAVARLLTGSSLWGVHVIQIVLGSIACGLACLAGRRLLGRGAGLAGGVILACYAPAVFYDGLIQKSVLDLFWMTLLILLVARMHAGPTPRGWLAAGAVLGALGLTRENALLLVPVLAAWLALRFADRTRTERARWSGAFVGGLALILLPVALRNAIVGGEFALTTSQAGVNFYIGNHAGAYGVYVPLRAGRGDARYERLDALDLAERAVGRRLTAGEASRYWFGEARRFIAGQPGQWLRLMARKLMLALNAYEIPDAEDLHFYARDCPLIRGLARGVHFGVLLPLAAAGMALTWDRRGALWVIYLMLAAILLGVVAFYVFGRYRYPLVPLLIPFAGAALVEAVRSVRARRVGRLTLAAGVAAGAALYANQPPGRIDRESQIAVGHANAAFALIELGRADEAVVQARQAVRIQPRLVEALLALGRGLAHAGRPDDAEAHLRQALSAWPDYAEAHNELGRLLARQRRWAEAKAALSEAVERDRVSAEFKVDLAWLLATCPDAAVRDGPRAVAMLEPLCAAGGALRRDPRALDALAAAYAEAGRFVEAAETARRAAECCRRREDRRLLAAIEAREVLYRSGRAHRMDD